MGTPTIVADGCAAREAVEDGVTGLWFKSGNVDSLASAMRELQNDAVIVEMSNKAYEAYWAGPATLERHVAETRAVYDRMLAKRAAV
jgi:glycosyltransferase involved in cell wall biosynthesis